jgi:hypothetical protein
MVMMASLVLLVIASSKLIKRGKELLKDDLILILRTGLGAGISAPHPHAPPVPQKDTLHNKYTNDNPLTYTHPNDRNPILVLRRADRWWYRSWG